MKPDAEVWRDVWRNRDDYADVLYRRAVGAVPEMESSKAAAALLRDYIKPGDAVLDVGCGGGHYLRSLRRLIEVPFTYTGVDATRDFLDVARLAWKGTPGVVFRQGDIYNLPFETGEFDVVICNNVLYHLPNINRPLAELMRVARRVVIARTLIGDRSFRVQEVFSSAVLPRSEVPPDDEFTDEGEPRSFDYLNIYSKTYFTAAVRRADPKASVQYIEDKFFDPEAIERSAGEDWKNPNPTRILDGRQVIGYIIVPYHFVIMEKT